MSEAVASFHWALTTPTQLFESWPELNLRNRCRSALLVGRSFRRTPNIAPKAALRQTTTSQQFGKAWFGHCHSSR